MVISLSDRQVNWLRLRAQRLSPQGVGDATRLLHDLCCVQAQDSPAGTLSLGVRGCAFTSADVDRARELDRSIIRIWSLRGTVHFHTTSDVGWLLPLLRPNFIGKGRSIRARYGLDDATCDRHLDELRLLMAGKGAMTGNEITIGLEERGVHLMDGARLFLMHYAAWKGLICMGPQRSAKPTYALLDEWITPGEALPREEALKTLAYRYLAAYAPATPEDCACWSGLPLTEIRAAWNALSGQLFAVENGGRTLWMLKDQQGWLDKPLPATPIVHLLPAFDTYLLGYKNRELIISAEYARRIYEGSMIYPTLLVDGCVQGRWMSKKRNTFLEVTMEPFVELTAAIMNGVEAAVADLERFVGMPVNFSVRPEGEKLTKEEV